MTANLTIIVNYNGNDEFFKRSLRLHVGIVNPKIHWLFYTEPKNQKNMDQLIKETDFADHYQIVSSIESLMAKLVEANNDIPNQSLLFLNEQQLSDDKMLNKWLKCDFTNIDSVTICSSSNIFLANLQIFISTADLFVEQIDSIHAQTFYGMLLEFIIKISQQSNISINHQLVNLEERSIPLSIIEVIELQKILTSLSHNVSIRDLYPFVDQEIDALFTVELIDWLKQMQAMIDTKESNWLDNYHTLTDKMNQLNVQNNLLMSENQALVRSKTYRVGNLIIKPLYLANRILHNPKLLLKGLKKITNRIKRGIAKLPRPILLYRKVLVNIQRHRLLIAPKQRYLIYVIYENQSQIQEYKYLFLDSLAELSDKVLIVVNGHLSDTDCQRLAKYGDIYQRENVGYDTAAFRAGILKALSEDLSNYKELLLVNDTNIGPISSLADVFTKMSQQKIDFWGISYGEEQPDITGYNKYGYIPKHLQSYFLVVHRNLFIQPAFKKYWEELTDTNSRFEAIGRHETVFTKYFADLGYRYAAAVDEYRDSAMYIHPLTMLKQGSPLIKYSALANYDNSQFIWQGLTRQTEVPALLEYVSEHSSYPIQLLEEIIENFKEKDQKNDYILIIDGVENIIPQCTRYRVLNKKESLEYLGYKVKVVPLSQYKLLDAKYASEIIIYRAPVSELLLTTCRLAREYGKKVYYDIDDLVIDTKYTDQLSYTQSLNEIEKQQYDASVMNYGKMLMQCDGVITSTKRLALELKNYLSTVVIDRNVASDELVRYSELALGEERLITNKVKLGYFSGSITHNENFELIKDSILLLLKNYDNVELHLVGYLDIPDDFIPYRDQLVVHDYVDWTKLPSLIHKIDINLAPLRKSIFNEAKSEIKWLEAALVKVPTVASDIGAFQEMIIDGQTGILCGDSQWYDKLKQLVDSAELRQQLAENAYQYVHENCITKTYYSESQKFFD